MKEKYNESKRRLDPDQINYKSINRIIKKFKNKGILC